MYRSIRTGGKIFVGEPFAYINVDAFLPPSMQTFLQELAADIVRHHKQLDKLVIVFPNRRAVIYFRKHLAALLSRPAFAPSMITIEDFFAGFSLYKVPDKLLLIQRLYDAYHETIEPSGVKREAFDKFYFWGEMLLRDFEEIDKYLIPAEQLFRDLTVQKELDATFDFLTDEQKSFLQSFWAGFENNISENKHKFLNVWNRLLPLYRLFRDRLATEGLAYEGMLQRLVVENTAALNIASGRQLVFAGFNALTKVEESLIAYFVAKHHAGVYWDIDAYYVNNNMQEAGKFFREYQRHEVLGQTFRHDVPSNFARKIGPPASDDLPVSYNSDGRTSVQLFGAPDPVSQAKLMSQIIRDQLALGLDPEQTLVVLPDEKLLLPVLHGLSPAVEKLNVTMGFPLSATPIFALAELLVDLQLSARRDQFNHRQVLALLGHPYVVAADFASAHEKRKEILRHNWVNIPSGYLATTVDIHRKIFTPVAMAGLIDYLRGVTIAVGGLTSVADLDKEYAFHFLTLLNRMDEVIGSAMPGSEGQMTKAGGQRQAGLKSFLRLLRQLIQSYKIPFSGEPLRGLQIMGVLETRNLDFKNVFILSLNEGALPGSSHKGSYLPFNIRKAYGLPTPEHQDAIYAYLFYRVLQRADNIFLFYNSETDVLGQGEMSRYLQQLIYESGIPIKRSVLHNTIHPAPVNPITIPKSPAIFDALMRANEGNIHHKGISPSALNTYIECRLRFYFRHVARIREADEVEEDLDARVLGNFLHGVMEMMYNDIVTRKGSRKIERRDLEGVDEHIDKLIDRVFIAAYRLDPDQPVDYAGQRVVVREVVRRFAHRIVQNDRAYTPFIIEATEQGGFFHRIKLPGTEQSIVISGKIDRVDRKDDVVRIIDYKTGKDQLDFESIESLFRREGKRNKAVFQTLLYALLYHVNVHTPGKIVPGLINRMNLFETDFQFGFKMNREPVHNAQPLFAEFESRLTELLHELYASDTPFDQTTNPDTCKLCEFKQICYRN